LDRVIPPRTLRIRGCRAGMHAAHVNTVDPRFRAEIRLLVSCGRHADLEGERNQSKGVPMRLPSHIASVES
jgi:hypothetical protein